MTSNSTLNSQVRSVLRALLMKPFTPIPRANSAVAPLFEPAGVLNRLARKPAQIPDRCWLNGELARRLKAPHTAADAGGEDQLYLGVSNGGSQTGVKDSQACECWWPNLRRCDCEGRVVWIVLGTRVSPAGSSDWRQKREVLCRYNSDKSLTQAKFGDDCLMRLGFFA